MFYERLAMSAPANDRSFQIGHVTLTVHSITESDLDSIAELIKKDHKNLVFTVIEHPELVRSTSTKLTVVEFDESNYYRQIIARVGGNMIQSSNGKFMFTEDVWKEIEEGDFSSLRSEIMDELTA